MRLPRWVNGVLVFEEPEAVSVTKVGGRRVRVAVFRDGVRLVVPPWASSGGGGVEVSRSRRFTLTRLAEWIESIRPARQLPPPDPELVI